MHPSKPNVYQTLVLVCRINIDRYLRPIGFPPLFCLNRNCEIAHRTLWIEKQPQSGWRGREGYCSAGIGGLHQSGYGVVRSRAGNACGRGLGRRAGVNACYAWTNQARLGIGHYRRLGPACKAAE